LEWLQIHHWPRLPACWTLQSLLMRWVVDCQFNKEDRKLAFL
jgi:hypothetical protein